MKIIPRRNGEPKSTAVIIDAKESRLQRSIDLRRKCLRALFDFSVYESGQANVSLATCCQKYGVEPGVAYAMRKEPKVKEMLDAAMAHNAMQGLALSENLLLKMLEDAGTTVLVTDEESGMTMAVEKAPMKPNDVISAVSLFRKIKGGGFVHKETAPNVLVQVNLPQISYSVEARAKAKVIADEEFRGLLGTGDGEEDADKTA